MQEMAQMTDEETLAALAKNLRRYRGQKTYGEVARAVGTYPSSIKRIEDGEHMPGVGLLQRIADSLGVTVDQLLRG